MLKLTLTARVVSYNPEPLLESRELLSITGPSVYNPGRHTVIDFGELSNCCEGKKSLPLHLHTSPEVGVISDYPQAPKVTLPAAPGDRVNILGVEWIIVCQRMANPVLILADDVAKFGETWSYPLIRPIV